MGCVSSCIRSRSQRLSLATCLHCFVVFALQDRESIRGKLSSTGRAVIELSFAETASFAGNCFELTDGTKRFLAISKRAKVRFSVHESTKSLPVPLRRRMPDSFHRQQSLMFPNRILMCNVSKILCPLDQAGLTGCVLLYLGM